MTSGHAARKETTIETTAAPSVLRVDKKKLAPIEQMTRACNT
jgi:hypothetical protein